jgi:hypothetical protein
MEVILVRHADPSGNPHFILCIKGRSESSLPDSLLGINRSLWRHLMLGLKGAARVGFLHINQLPDRSILGAPPGNLLVVSRDDCLALSLLVQEGDPVYCIP